jgi:hypothetical protein
MTRSHSSGRYTTTSLTTAVSSTAAASKTTTDPAALLARGYTARYLGAVLHKHITALSDEEMERDLRHITAYQEAATRYHQLTYAANNRLPISPDGEIAVDGYAAQHGHAYEGSASSNAAALSSYTVLPVRIDPEEEKRAAVQAKRIQRAEAVREELETHYVALRAHYVVTTQELQQLQSDLERTVDFLQTTVASTAATVGYQRARLEMTRNVRAALSVRTAALQRADPGIVTDPTQYVSTAEQCPMLAAWLAVEEDCKRHFAAPPAKSKKTKLGTNSTVTNTATTLPWSCTTQPLMPPGVPILLSALSTDPCKSLAAGVGPMFGSSQPHNMTWIGLHLPNEVVEDMSDAAGGGSGADQQDGPDKPTASGNLVDDDTNDLLAAETDAVDRLREEVAYLEHELVAERHANQALLVTTASARTQQDEWVAMISLVRQETEAVLHRHNVLLESDEVRDAAVAWPAESSTAAAAAATLPDESKVEHSIATATGPTARAASKESMEDEEEGDHANEADDEGMAEEGEEGDDWDSNHPATAAAAALPTKRTAGPTEESEESSPGGSRKRRKV